MGADDMAVVHVCLVLAGITGCCSYNYSYNCCNAMHCVLM